MGRGLRSSVSDGGQWGSASSVRRLNGRACDCRTADCIVVRSEDALRIQLTQRQQRAAGLNDFAEARIISVELRRHVARVRM